MGGLLMSKFSPRGGEPRGLDGPFRGGGCVPCLDEAFRGVHPGGSGAFDAAG